jgi:AraC-like DNA-binding protein
LSKNTTIGLLQGQQIMPHHHGVWGYAMQTSANLGQALCIFNQYFDVVGPIAKQMIEVEGKIARWISKDILPLGIGRRVAVEEMLSGNFTLFRQLTEQKFELQALYVDYEAPIGFEAYEELFQCPVYFEQNRVEMHFDASLLNLRMRYSDPETVRVCEESCIKLLEKISGRKSTVEQVRQVIYESSCDERDIDTVSGKLCVSSRTLRRQLSKEKSTFRTVLNEVLKSVAIDYLTSTDLSVDEISYLLGYSETSNFRHAFKVWTGQNPSYYHTKGE